MGALSAQARAPGLQHRVKSEAGRIGAAELQAAARQGAEREPASILRLKSYSTHEGQRAQCPSAAERAREAGRLPAQSAGPAAPGGGLWKHRAVSDRSEWQIRSLSTAFGQTWANVEGKHTADQLLAPPSTDLQHETQASCS